MANKPISLIIGACGQIGTDLTLALRKKYGNDLIIASDVKTPHDEIQANGHFEFLDVLDIKALKSIVHKYKVTQIYNLAAVLSATGEKKPKLAWRLNMEGLINVLDVAKEFKLDKIFWPSSIAVFGPSTKKNNTPQLTIMEPNTVYGISKLAGERWCEYYHQKYSVDVRSIRYPGLISYKSEPGGGTTDYAIEIFYEALKTGKYECFLTEDTTLPMMYMPDAIRGTIALMESDISKISIRSSYNMAGISFSPKEIVRAIKKHIPEFNITYNPDFRQKVADGWPASIDDSIARQDWGWQPEYNMLTMIDEMLENIKNKILTNNTV